MIQEALPVRNKRQDPERIAIHSHAIQTRPPSTPFICPSLTTYIPDLIGFVIHLAILPCRICKVTFSNNADTVTVSAGPAIRHLQATHFNGLVTESRCAVPSNNMRDHRGGTRPAYRRCIHIFVVYKSTRCSCRFTNANPRPYSGPWLLGIQER